MIRVVDRPEQGARAGDLARRTSRRFSTIRCRASRVTYFRERDKQIEVRAARRGGRARAASASSRISRSRRATARRCRSRRSPTSATSWRTGSSGGATALPTITVRARRRGDAQGPDVAKRIDPQLDAIRAELPLGYRIEIGGAIEDSARGQNSIAAGVPLLAVDGADAADDPAAELFAHADGGADRAARADRRHAAPARVRQAVRVRRDAGHRSRCRGSSCATRSSWSTRSSRTSPAGHAPWDAVVGATVRRFRPIVLTAAAAVLAMIPLVRSDFFGPMAVAMMGGIVVATVLTLAFCRRSTRRGSACGGLRRQPRPPLIQQASLRGIGGCWSQVKWAPKALSPSL